MDIKITGRRKVSFDGNNGDKITGKSYHYLYTADGAEGYLTDRVFVMDGRSDPFVIGQEYQVFFKRNGKIDLDNVESR